MRFSKRVFLMLMVLALAVSFVFVMSSCSKKNNNKNDSTAHEHAYASEVIAPTCVAGGYTKYTCACGDTYTGNETAATAQHSMVNVAAKAPTCIEVGYAADHKSCTVCGHTEGDATVLNKTGHKNTTTYVYPTVNEAGSKTSVCSVCNHTETKTLDAMTVSNPKVSAFVAKLIGSVAYSVEIGENSSFVYIMDSDNDEVHADSKDMIVVKVLEAAISGKNDKLAGHLGVEFVISSVSEDETVEAYEETITASIFVNGDDVSIEVTSSEMDEATTDSVNLTETLYNIICNMAYVEYEDAVTIYYVFNQIAKCLPIAEGIIDNIVDSIPEISENCGQAIVDIFELINKDIIVEINNADGSTSYKVDLAALKHVLDLIEEEKALEAYIESLFGAESSDEILEFIETLPNKTIKEISEAIIEIAEATDASIEDLYYIVDFIIYWTTDTEICIENEIYSRYDMTLAELIAEANGVTGEDAEELISAIQDAFAEAVNFIETTTVKNFINMMIGADADDELTFIEDIEQLIDELDGVVSLEFVLNAEGKLASFEATMMDGTVVCAFVEDDGTITATVIVDGAEVVLTYTEGHCTVVGKYEDDVIFSGEIVENNGAITATVVVDGGVEVVLTYTEGHCTVVGKYEGDVVFSGDVSMTEVVNGDETTKKFTVTYETEYATITYVTEVTVRGNDIVKADVSIVAKDAETSEVYYDYSAEITQGENSLKLDVYMEAYGDVMVDGSVTLEAAQNGSKTEYTLAIDADKIFMGYGYVYDYVYDEYWGYGYTTCVAMTMDSLAINAVIRLVAEK